MSWIYNTVSLNVYMQHVSTLRLFSHIYAAVQVNSFACFCLPIHQRYIKTLHVFTAVVMLLLVPVPSASNVSAAAATVAVHGIFYAPVITERSASCLLCAS